VLNNVMYEDTLSFSEKDIRDAINQQTYKVTEQILSSSDKLGLEISALYILKMTEARSTNVQLVVLTANGRKRQEWVRRLHSLGYSLAIDAFVKIVKGKL